MKVELQGKYFNLVAVYQEGPSEFIQGVEYDNNVHWVTNPAPLTIDNTRHIPLLKKTGTGYFWNFENFPANVLPQYAAIYSCDGRLISRIETIQDNQPVLDRSCVQGVYLIKMVLQDKSFVSQQIYPYPLSALGSRFSCIVKSSRSTFSLLLQK